jgi:hypothetical protein
VYGVTCGVARPSPLRESLVLSPVARAQLASESDRRLAKERAHVNALGAELARNKMQSTNKCRISRSYTWT